MLMQDCKSTGNPFTLKTGVRLIAGAFLLLAAAACEQKSPAPVHQPVQFAKAPPIKLNVAKIEIFEVYRPSLKKPNVEHLFPQPPAAVIRKWAATRLRAVGSSGTGILKITNAAAIEQNLTVKKGLKGLVTRDQAKRYVATVNAQLILRSGTGSAQAVARGKFQVSQTAPENLSLNDRERLFHTMAQDIAKNFDEIMRAAIARHLANFIR